MPAGTRFTGNQWYQLADSRQFGASTHDVRGKLMRENKKVMREIGQDFRNSFDVYTTLAHNPLEIATSMSRSALLHPVQISKRTIATDDEVDIPPQAEHRIRRSNRDDRQVDAPDDTRKAATVRSPVQ